MEHPMNSTYIKPEEALLKIKDGALLIHTLPAEHFAKIHLPAAANACVYQLTFIDDMRTIGADKDSVIVLYGSSNHSLYTLKKWMPSTYGVWLVFATIIEYMLRFLGGYNNHLFWPCTLERNKPVNGTSSNFEWQSS
jgi:hypothetical protein